MCSGPVVVESEGVLENKKEQGRGGGEVCTSRNQWLAQRSQLATESRVLLNLISRWRDDLRGIIDPAIDTARVDQPRSPSIGESRAGAMLKESTADVERAAAFESARGRASS